MISKVCVSFQQSFASVQNSSTCCFVICLFQIYKQIMDDPFICPQCGNEYNTRSILIRHLSSHAEKQVKCHLCQKKFSQKDHLKRHTDSIHYQLKKWECNRCDAKFSRKEHLMNHKQTIHEEEQIFKRSERKGEKKNILADIVRKVSI